MSGSAECPLPPSQYSAATRAARKNTSSLRRQEEACSALYAAVAADMASPWSRSPTQALEKQAAASMLLPSSNAVSRPNRYLGGRGHGTGRWVELEAAQRNGTLSHRLQIYQGKRAVSHGGPQEPRARAT